MPHEYVDSYSQKAIAQHHHIFQRRGDALVDVGIFEKRGDLTGIIVVAGDRQGLLALITEAFVVCGLDVVAGDAFTREDGALKEAIDLFWVRGNNNGAPVGDAEMNKLRATLLSLAEGYATPVPTLVGTAPGGHSNSTVRFIEDKNGALSILEVETEDRSGLLLSLTRALHAQNVQILRSEVRTTGSRVFDRFVIAEPDGSPVSDLRRLEIQVSILSAAEPAKRLASTPPSPLQTA